MSSLKEVTAPYSFEDALACAKKLGRSQGSWGRFADFLESLDAEERAVYSDALEQQGITDDVDYVMAIEG